MYMTVLFILNCIAIVIYGLHQRAYFLPLHTSIVHTFEKTLKKTLKKTYTFYGQWYAICLQPIQLDTFYTFQNGVYACNILWNQETCTSGLEKMKDVNVFITAT